MRDSCKSQSMNAQGDTAATSLMCTIQAISAIPRPQQRGTSIVELMLFVTVDIVH